MSDEESPDEPPQLTPEQIELLEELGKLARECDREVSMQEREQWAEWDALAAGTLDPESAQRLREQAEEDDELEARWEAFRPLDGDLRAKIAGQLERRGADAAAAPPATDRRPPRGVPRWSVVAAGAAALAAAVALAVLPGRTPDVVAQPVITSDLSSGERSFRGPEDELSDARVPEFLPGTSLRWNLRPDEARPGVEAETFLEVDGQREAWTPPVRLGDSGAVLIEGPAGALLGDRRGLVTLGVVLRWPDGAEVVVRERVRLLEARDP